jgi:hypothetical protein
MEIVYRVYVTALGEAWPFGESICTKLKSLIEIFVNDFCTEFYAIEQKCEKHK